jgi:hypothetical protein
VGSVYTIWEDKEWVIRVLKDCITDFELEIVSKRYKLPPHLYEVVAWYGMFGYRRPSDYWKAEDVRIPRYVRAKIRHFYKIRKVLP